MSLLHLEVGDWAYLATSQDELDSLLSGGDMLSSLREDGEFDFASLDPRVVELVYGKGRWWKFRDRPGVARLAAEIRRGRLPPFVIWEVERLHVHYGAELGERLHIWSTVNPSETDLDDHFIETQGEMLCSRLRELDYQVVPLLTERSRDLLMNYTLIRVNRWFSKGWEKVNPWEGCGVGLSYKNLGKVCVLFISDDSLNEFVRFAGALGATARQNALPLEKFPDYNHVFSTVLECEWVLGSYSPVLAFVGDGTGGFARAPSYHEMKRLGMTPVREQVVFVLDADLDGSNPALARIRELSP